MITQTFRNLGLLVAFGALLTGCGASPQTYVERGNRFYESGKFQDAAIQYQRAIQKAPRLGAAHYHLGLTDLKLGLLTDAYRELRTAVDLMPNDVDANSTLGQLALDAYSADRNHPKQLYEQANKAADKLLGKSPQGFEGNVLKGAISLVEANSQAAVAHFRAAVKAKPNDMPAQFGLARALVADKQAAAGLDLTRQIIQRDKTFGAAYDFLFAQYRAAGKMDEAEDVLKLKVSNNPRNAAYLLELAGFYSAQKPGEVPATLDKLTGNPGVFPDGRMQAGDFYASLGKPDDAVRNYQQGLSDNPKNPDPWHRKMFTILAAQHKWPEALAQIDAVVKDKPGDQDARLIRAVAWIDEGKPENLDPAIAEIRAQIAKKVVTPAVHFELGNALARKNDRDAAQQEWSAAAKQDPRYLPPRFAIAETQIIRGNPQAALATAEEILAVTPLDLSARLLHAACLTGTGQYQRAQMELDRLAVENPKSPQVQFRRGVLAISEKKYSDAETIFHRLDAAGGKDLPVIEGLVQAYQGEKEPARALELLQNKVKESPDSLQLRSVLAGVAAVSGKYDIAIEQYRFLAGAAPGSTDIALRLATVYQLAGNTDAALQVLEKAVQAQPKSSAAAIALAQALISAHRIDEAKARYRDLLKTDPDNPQVLNDLAYLMADTGENPDQALALAQRGLQHVSEPGLKTSLSDTLGWIYLKKNMNDAALQTFQVLVQSNPGNAAFHYHLGTALFRKGDKQAARSQLQAALANKPGPQDEPAIRALLAQL